MLMEAQLEKQLESITISQTYEEEMSQVKHLTKVQFSRVRVKCLNILAYLDVFLL